ncbi:MAG: hypothetical protein ACI8TQ_003139 [Planctomycetota bacterium]|jgi:hypothetical protein
MGAKSRCNRDSIQQFVLFAADTHRYRVVHPREVDSSGDQVGPSKADFKVDSHSRFFSAATIPKVKL